MSIYTIDLQTFKQDCKVSKTDKLEYGEIYTPFAFIKQMLDLFDPAVFQDPSKTWLDVGAGQGYFSMILFSLLNMGLAFIIKEETARKTHIVQKMLYMVELKESNVTALREMFGIEANILGADYCTHDFSSNERYDYIIGNPPYNAHGIKKVPTNTVLEKKQDGITLWTQFIRKSLNLLRPQTGQLCMIVPALWLKPDKSGLHHLLTQYKIEKIHCLSSNETNTIFKGEAQTPTCYFLLSNSPKKEKAIQLYDTRRQAYVAFPHTPGQAIPLFGSYLIHKLHPWLLKAGALKVIKTNMPSKKSQFTEQAYTEAYPYANITTCTLERLQPVLLMNYSDIPQPFHGVKKLVLAHKMYGFPYWDKEGHYGIANRDNYVIVDKTPLQFARLQAFLSTKFALYLFAAARYRMKYLEKYAFEFIPDITKLIGFPQDITDETVADFFGLDTLDKTHIQSAHKNYGRFI